MRKIFIIILLLFLIVGIIGFWYWIRNPFSRDILKLEIFSSREADLFEKVEYQVRYRNNGNVRLDEPILIFEFPTLTIPDEGFSLRNEIELDSIYPGEERTIVFSGRLIGAENENKQAKVSLNYKPRNITASYESTTSFSTSIRPIPITFDLEIASKVPAERAFNFSIEYFSRLNYPLSNLKIEIKYPAGFSFLESVPSGVEQNEWEIPLLNSLDGGRIEIRGELKGETQDQKYFEARLGIWRDGNFIPLKESTKATEISDPDLYIFQRINNKDNYIPSPGELINYQVFFRNIGSQPFSDLNLIVRLRGDFFDTDSVKTIDGQKLGSDIIWDWRDVSKLQFLDKGEEGMVEFWVEVKDTKNLPGQGRLINTVSISRLTEEFFTKINTQANLQQRAYYHDDVFGNRGPIPPKVGELTTYTINWQINNFNNELKDVIVKATLPYNVRLTGEFFPKEKEDQITFDSQSREIAWRVGDVSPSKNPLSVSFQVGLSPIANQVGQVATIINQAEMSGNDSWTQEKIKKTSSKIETNLPHDPFLNEEGIIQGNE